MNKDYANKANKIIFDRRNKAEYEKEQRIKKINKEIPEISEIREQMAGTGKKIIDVIKSGKNAEEVKKQINKLREENKQAQSYIKYFLKERGYSENYLEADYKCKKCNDTGMVNGEQCSCFQTLYRKIAAEDFNKNSHVTLNTFETFDLNYYKNAKLVNGKSAYGIMKQVFIECYQYAKNFSKNSGSILMIGKTGLGKTHLSLAIASEVVKKDYNVVYDSTVNILYKIESEHFNKIEFADTLTTVLDSDLLILDDLGTEFNSQFNVSMIYNIINTRLSKNKPTIVSTNLTVADLRKRYEERITSRLLTSFTAYNFVGNDIRAMKKNIKIGD